MLEIPASPTDVAIWSAIPTGSTIRKIHSKVWGSGTYLESQHPVKAGGSELKASLAYTTSLTETHLSWIRPSQNKGMSCIGQATTLSLNFIFKVSHLEFYSIATLVEKWPHSIPLPS